MVKENKDLLQFNMKEQQLLSWIENQKSILDQIIFEAGENFHEKNKGKANFRFDLSECQSESFNLIGNKDLCYDRYCTPFVYSLWYHARRLNTFLRFFSRAILSSNDRLIEIFDLGAGTGAVQFAAGLVYLGMKELGLNPPNIRVVNIDTSPFMLAYNNEFLWQAFLNKYQGLKNNPNFTVEYNVNSWNVKTEQQAINPWITASYLFDISDKKEVVTNDFFEIIKHYNPTTILLLTSNQEAKVKLLNGVLDKIRTQKYIVEEVNETSLLFRGSLDKVNIFRRNLSETYQGKGLGNSSNWSDSSFVGTILRKSDQSFNLVTKNTVTNIDLFNPKVKVRKDIKLSDQQKKASQFTGRPSIVVGPAGSGKSVVISEKIKYIVENQSYNPNLKILVTSFNKSLIKKLGEWTGQMLNQNYFKKTMISDEASTFTFTNSTFSNITLMHFDLLPTRLGNIKGTCYDDEQHIRIMQGCIEEVKKNREINHNLFDNFLDAQFVYEEYHRIFYGMHVKSKEVYLTVKRKGMWQPLSKERREIIYDCINLYMNRIFDKNKKIFNPHSFLTRRRILLNNLKSNELTIKYDYVFVDEFQDCTKADFEIFFNLIKDVNNLTFAGDLAQAIHIGKSADIPRDENMSRRERFLLEGSYRLPQRISESIKKLSETIVQRWNSNEGAKEIAPVKNSPPGARPIVVYAPDLNSILKKIESIFQTYKIYDINKITILEKDRDLYNSLSEMKVECETDTILRLKGLEKDCILWSTRKSINDDKEVYEFVYTILTRTSSILIIALSDSTQDNFKKVINLLDRDKLILWDFETKQKYSSFCQQYEPETLQYE